MTGGLFDPLGTTEREATPSTPRLPAAAMIAGLALAGLATLIAVAYLRDGGDRGVPTAISTIEHVASSPTAPVSGPSGTPPPPAVGTPAAAVDPPPARDDQEVEIQNGVRIIRPRRDRGQTSGQTLKVPDPVAASAAAGR